MKTASPSYHTPWDDWYEYPEDLEPHPILAICYWQVAGPDGSPLMHFDTAVVPNPEDPDVVFGAPYPCNESLLLIW